MPFTVEATYENGILKLAEPLPLKEHEKVQVTVHTPAEFQAEPASGPRGYGLLRWTGTRQDLDYLIEDADNDPLEGP